MAERITIAELNIDDSALVRSSQAIIEQIDSLRQSQKQLDRSTEEGRTQFVRNATTIRSLNTEYRNNQRALNQRITVTQDATVREEQLNQVLEQEVTTITEAREQTQVLTRLRNETNATTEEGTQLIEQLNQQLDRNTEFIRENADAHLQNRLNVGNYTESLQEALGSINPFNGGISGFIARAQEAGGVGNLLTTSISGVGTALVGLTRAALVFLATPIGVVVAALAAGFLLVQNALSRSEEATNRLSGAFAGISGILNAVLRALEPSRKYFN